MSRCRTTGCSPPFSTKPYSTGVRSARYTRCLETGHPCWNQDANRRRNPLLWVTLSYRVCQRSHQIERISDMVVDHQLWDAMEGRRTFLQFQTDLWGRSAHNVSRGDVPRDQDGSELLQHAGCYSGSSEATAGRTGRNPSCIVQHGRNYVQNWQKRENVTETLARNEQGAQNDRGRRCF